MTWRQTFTELAGVSVSGVVSSFDLDELPNVLPSADLPALVPLFGQESGVFAEGEPGFSTLTYDGSVWTSTLQVDHVLYWSPAWSDAGLSAALPDLVDAVDNYLTAIKAAGTLNDTLDRELEITRIEPGVVEYAGVTFFGVRFRHRWTRVVG